MGTCLARFVHSIDRPLCTGRTRPQATESSVHVVFPSQKVVYTEVFLAQKKVLHSVLSRRNYGRALTRNALATISLPLGFFGLVGLQENSHKTVTNKGNPDFF